MGVFSREDAMVEGEAASASVRATARSGDGDAATAAKTSESAVELHRGVVLVDSESTFSAAATASGGEVSAATASGGGEVPAATASGCEFSAAAAAASLLSGSESTTAVELCLFCLERSYP
jgi:hypothetical protein